MTSTRPLNEIFSTLFAKYPKALFNEDRSIVSPDFDDAVAVIRAVARSAHPDMTPSYGTGSGNMTFTPYISILHASETETTMKGVYCVYLFRADMKGAYLTGSRRASQRSRKQRRTLTAESGTLMVICSPRSRNLPSIKNVYGVRPTTHTGT